jgi:1-acyl-sn-glycerol-3-phosphate acyltransferase
MEEWSKGYALVKILVYYTFWLSHKRIAVIGKENIPKNKPLIFAPNHQNALMDPLAVLLTNRTQPVWLARADIFRFRWARPILRFLKIVPVFRIRDGKENLQNNEDTFALAVRVLENKQALALFPEAAHTGKRRMIAHKKAIPRIAFLAEGKNNFRLDLHIVPVGIYYNHYWEFNRSVIVNYGVPIRVRKYENAFRENEHTATLALRDELYNSVLPLTLNINSTGYYEEYELARELAGCQFAANRHFANDPFVNRFFSDRMLIANLEVFERQDPVTFQNMANSLRSFGKQKKQMGLSCEHLKGLKGSRIFLILLHLVVALVSLPLFFPGFLFNGLQFLVLRRFIHKKVKDPVFKGSFNLVAGMVLFPLIHLVLAVIIGGVLQSLSVAFVLFLIMPLLGKFSYQLFEFYRSVAMQVKMGWFSATRHRELTSFLRIKQELTDRIIDAAENNSVIFEP